MKGLRRVMSELKKATIYKREGIYRLAGKASYLRIRQGKQPGDHSVHHVVIIDDVMLTTPHQTLYKLQKVALELLKQWPSL